MVLFFYCIKHARRILWAQDTRRKIKTWKKIQSYKIKFLLVSKEYDYLYITPDDRRSIVSAFRVWYDFRIIRKGQGITFSKNFFQSSLQKYCKPVRFRRIMWYSKALSRSDLGQFFYTLQDSFDCGLFSQCNILCVRGGQRLRKFLCDQEDPLSNQYTS